MKTNTVAPIGGLIILTGALVLSFYIGTNSAAKSAADAKTINKYILLSDKALANGDSNKAESIMQKALVVDPKNKVALAAYKKVILSAAPTATASTTPAKTVNKPTPTVAKPKAAPEDQMGCI